MPKQANLTCVMIVQQLEETYWTDWDDTEPITLARDGNCRPLLEAVIERFNDADIPVSEAYGILHDKDEVNIWNQKEMKNIVEKKVKHIHFLLKFEKGASLQKLALTVGLEMQYLEKLKSGRYGYDNCLAYLVHAKDNDKFQYSPEEVVTILGEDYVSLYNRQMETWVKGRATKEAKDTQLSVDYLISEIIQGNLTRSNILLSNDLYKVYALHKRKINEAIDTFGEKKSYESISDLEQGKFKKTILFISAESGVGKTVLSKEIIKELQSISKQFGSAWDFCMTASTNAFDEYNGHDILFLDDIRGDSLSVSDWLKLLDPYTISPISARYHNKMGSAKVIIITSIKEPINFFVSAKGNVGEDLGQFLRRIDYLIKIDKQFHISVPERNETYTKLIEKKGFSYEYHSYIFSKKKSLSKKEAINKVVKSVMKNMQWNKKKSVSPKPTKAKEIHSTNKRNSKTIS